MGIGNTVYICSFMGAYLFCLLLGTSDTIYDAFLSLFAAPKICTRIQSQIHQSVWLPHAKYSSSVLICYLPYLEKVTRVLACRQLWSQVSHHAGVSPVALLDMVLVVEFSF